MALLLCLLFVVLSSIGPIYTEDVCVKKDACICEFSNGTGIDLNPAAVSSFYTTQKYEVKDNETEYVLSLYYYHPCKDIILNISSLTPSDTCRGELSGFDCMGTTTFLFLPQSSNAQTAVSWFEGEAREITGTIELCRHVNTLKKNIKGGFYTMTSGPYEYMGKSADSEFSADGKSIIYNNGPSTTTVLLHCAETDDDLTIFSMEDPRKIVLAFFSRHACLKKIEDTGRSVGSTLLIVFFSMVIFYIILGICTKKFLMGATGVEVIPNLAFWSDLPNLVKDGWAFARNGFKLPPRGPGPVTSPDPNSYDSI